ncbi:MAG: hypothetical protein ACI88L_000321 [Candidatus Paceibacteria bacterium]|jgi:hypothetical protein
MKKKTFFEQDCMRETDDCLGAEDYDRSSIETGDYRKKNKDGNLAT